MKRIKKKILLSHFYKGNKRIFKKYFNKIKHNTTQHNTTQRCDDNYNKWLEKWSVFGEIPIEAGWTVFHEYMSDNINFVPNDIGRNFIEPILTPYEYQPFYNDKNSFGLILDSNIMPRTFFRSIKGYIYNGDYESVSEEDFKELLNGVDKIVVKPTRNMGGKGVALFTRNGEDFIDSEKNILSMSYLKETYKTDYLIQECLTQSDFMSQFNESSVNTLRIATYRNVKNGNIEVLCGVMRVGRKGTFVDNASSGGSFISIALDGTLGKFVCDEYGVKQSIFNGIDFEHNTFVIPNYDKIKNFVIDVSKHLPHMSLFAHDVAIDEDGHPKLIEVNTTQFSYWLYQFNNTPVFGDFTDELIAHCLKVKDNVEPYLSIRYNV